MAEQLASFRFKNSSATCSRYPWHLWEEGVWKLTKGEDFSVDPQSFRSAVQLAAKRKGMHVQTSLQGDSVIFQFTPREAK